MLGEPYTLHVSVGSVPVPVVSTGKFMSYFQEADKIMYEKKAAYKKTLARKS